MRCNAYDHASSFRKHVSVDRLNAEVRVLPALVGILKVDELMSQRWAVVGDEPVCPIRQDSRCDASGKESCRHDPHGGVFSLLTALRVVGQGQLIKRPFEPATYFLIRVSGRCASENPQRGTVQPSDEAGAGGVDNFGRGDGTDAPQRAASCRPARASWGVTRSWSDSYHQDTTRQFNGPNDGRG